jgi:5-methyltetrahydropteroyltriglutamate--homocysteine methyltransferase
MPRTRPPFRADMVGSLLRPKPIHDARQQHAKGELSDADLRQLEDDEIIKLVDRQEAIGLQAVTDGELRRAWWHYDFLAGLDGVEMVEVAQGIQFAGVQTKAEAPRVTGKIDFSSHPMVGHFEFLKKHTKKLAKMTIPSPSMLHYRSGRRMINMGLYPNMESFYGDLAAAYRKAVNAFAQVGCRYLQLDDVSFAYLCDPAQRRMLADRGDDPTKQPKIYATMINEAVRDRPADMTISMHLCRGNFRSTFVASGGYEPVADLLFNGINVDAYFMEWDTERAGGFEPLRFLPKGKTVVLGLVTSKTGALEKSEDLLRRIEEAARFAPLEQLCLSPQCGFASTEEGNRLSEAEQWAKLALVVETAAKVWN